MILMFSVGPIFTTAGTIVRVDNIGVELKDY